MSSIGSVSSYTDSSSSEEANTSTVVAKSESKKPKWQQHVTDKWLESVKQSQKYRLILNGLQFCRTWTISDCFRDLIQNATDSMYGVHKKHHGCKRPRVVIDHPPGSWEKNQKTITKIYLECEKGGRTNPVGYLIWTPQDKKYDGPVISIINLDSGFSPNALCVGISTKGIEDAGGHGEGLKAAVTVAIRANNAFEIVQSGVAIHFGKSKDTVNYRVVSPINKILQFKPLTKQLTKQLGVSAQKDVIIHVGNNPALKFEEYQEAVGRFLFLTHRHPNSLEVGNFPVVNRKETKSGRAILLGDEFAGKVYVVGIYFKTNHGFQQSYGVDFIRSDALSRDRNEISQSKYVTAMEKLISELLEEDPKFAEVILDEFQQAEKDPLVAAHLGGLPECTSIIAKKNMLDAYKRKPENADIKYIVSGTSANNLTSNDIVPKWCDVMACKVVHPALFGLISDGYPSLEAIKYDTSMKLEACPSLLEQQEELCTWLQENKEFFQNIDPELFSQIEVRQTAEMLDVPLYIIKEGKIIFSERALNIRLESPRQFLDLANDALQEACDQTTIKPEEIKPKEINPEQVREHLQPLPLLKLDLLPLSPEEYVQDSAFDKNPLINSLVKDEFQAPSANKSWDFTTDFALSNDWGVDDDDEEEIEMLEKSLSQNVCFGEHTISSTPDAKQFILENKPAIEVLTNRCIYACFNALRLLTGAQVCKLSFFIAPNSEIQGYASGTSGICINLRSVLLGNDVEESALKAYFDVLISHEYAHYVKLHDGHCPEHGQRTEGFMQKLLHEAYMKSAIGK